MLDQEFIKEQIEAVVEAISETIDQYKDSINIMEKMEIAEGDDGLRIKEINDASIAICKNNIEELEESGEFLNDLLCDHIYIDLRILKDAIKEIIKLNDSKNFNVGGSSGFGDFYDIIIELKNEYNDNK